MKKKFKQALIPVLSFCALFALTSCGSSTPKEIAPSTVETVKEADTRETPIRIGLLRIDDSFPFYVAREEGLFDKYDVDVELYDFGSARDQSTALMGGELDGVMTDPVVTALSIKGGTDLRIVAMALGADPSEGRFLVVSSPESDIKTPEDLIGKTIAISDNTMMDYLTTQYLKALGIDRDAVNFVNMPDLMLRTTTIIEGGDIDAAILPDPLAAYTVSEGANIVIDDTTFDENFSQSVVALTKDCIDTEPEEVKAMLAAYNEAIEMINADPEHYNALALTCANVPESLSDSYPTPTFTPHAIPDENCINAINEWMVSRGLLDQAFAYTDMVDTQFIK